MPNRRNGEDENNKGGRAKPVQYEASIYPGPGMPIPKELGKTVLALQKSLARPVWLLLQSHEGPLPHVEDPLVEAFIRTKEALVAGEPIALLVDSPGGDARAAYLLARFLRIRCGGFMAIVPRAAWSAATLLVLGADSILMGSMAALGPLDAQIWDAETEDWRSVLNEVQALERLHAYALEAIDETMLLLLQRTRKRVDTLLPHVLRFVSDWSRPLLEKIDVVHYNEQSRILKVAEEYATRLLLPRYPKEAAEALARHLAEKYPEHGFPILSDEARTLGEIGLTVENATEEQTELLDRLYFDVGGQSVIGRVREVEVK